MVRCWLIVAWACFLFLSLVSTEAQADEERDLQKFLSQSRLVLGVDSTLLGYDATRYKHEKHEDSEVRYKTFEDRFQAAWGNPNLGFFIGRFIPEQTLMGAHLGIGWTHSEVGDSGSVSSMPVQNTLTMTLSPVAEFLFLSGMVRPFMRTVLECEASWLNEQNIRDGKKIDEVSTNVWSLGLLLGGGTHIFVTNNLSIDLALMLGVAGGGSISKHQFHNALNNQSHTRVEDEALFVRFRLQTLLSISTWI